MNAPHSPQPFGRGTPRVAERVIDREDDDDHLPQMIGMAAGSERNAVST